MKNRTNSDLPSLTKGLIYFVIIVHLMFFTLEAIFWMKPEVNQILLGFLNNPVNISYPLQALTLKSLFINQGFYNLFISIAGIVGLYLVSKRSYPAGYALILFLCFCGFGAGVTLALTTNAYLLAFFQGAPAIVAFSRVYKLSGQFKD